MAFLFLPFKSANDRESHKQDFLPIMEVIDYNVLTDGGNFFDQPVKTDLIKMHDIITKIMTGQGDNYTTGCLLDYPYFKNMLETNCNRFRPKRNMTNQFYWKSK